MNNSVYDISQTQAQKIVLSSQGLHTQNGLGKGLEATKKAIEMLGYVQIDTISVVERAHHHTLWNRVKNYSQDHLNILLTQGEIFEYWSHAAAYLPMRDYRFSLPRKKAFADGEKHWRERNDEMCLLVLERITEEGPLQAKDFEQDKKKGDKGWWQWKPAKVALEQLFMEGQLMIAQRKGFQKVYDLPKRILPGNVITDIPSDVEFHQHLIRQYLKSNGVGTPAEIAYLRKGIKPMIAQQCLEMLEDGELVLAKINQQKYYALPNVEELLNQSFSRNKVKILSPFDNILIQRQRTREIFNFNYQVECYVPAAKRLHGYFSLPLLCGQTFAGRLDAKIDRKSGILNLVNLHFEIVKTDKLIDNLILALKEFLLFNRGNQIEVTKITSSTGGYSQSKLNELKKELLSKLLK